MAGIVGSAVVQEAISRVSSVIFRKHEEKVSRKDSIERLEMAHTELELAIERSGCESRWNVVPLGVHGCVLYKMGKAPIVAYKMSTMTCTRR
jgi:hypothetical protein